MSRRHAAFLDAGVADVPCVGRGEYGEALLQAAGVLERLHSTLLSSHRSCEHALVDGM